MKNIFTFLEKLGQNNNRPWFMANKKEYEVAHNDMVLLTERVYSELSKTDVLDAPNGKKCVHRIYRDIRFKADKTPYKNNFSARFMRAGASRRGSYYFHIEKGNCFVGGGFWAPNPTDLQTIRERIVLDEDLYRETLNNPDFLKYFGQIKGEQLKTCPKGFDKESSALAFIKNKQFLLQHFFTEKEIASPNFHITIVEALIAMRPYFDLMSEFLTTDLNGQSLLKD